MFNCEITVDFSYIIHNSWGFFYIHKKSFRNIYIQIIQIKFVFKMWFYINNLINFTICWTSNFVKSSFVFYTLFSKNWSICYWISYMSILVKKLKYFKFNSFQLFHCSISLFSFKNRDNHCVYIQIFIKLDNIMIQFRFDEILNDNCSIWF